MANYPQLDNASGVWNLREVYDAVMGGYWPNANNRAIVAGGFTPSYTSVISDFNMASSGTTTVFGNLDVGRGEFGAMSNFTRCVFAGGNEEPGSTNSDSLSYVQFATKGNVADFGNIGAASQRTQGVGGNATRGVFTEGNSDTNQIQYITIDSLGDAIDFGDRTVSGTYAAGVTSPTRTCFGGAFTPSTSNIIDFIEIATTGNATDFGDLSNSLRDAGGCSSSTRGVFMGGITPTSLSTLDFITIASQGNATDYGDLTYSARGNTGVSDSVRGFSVGGANPGTALNVLDRFVISTGGNAVDFADLVESTKNAAVNSASHGGLNDGYQGTRPLPFQEGGGDRGIIAGGSTASKFSEINFITISSTGTEQTFGDLSQARNGAGGIGGKTRYITGGGNAAPVVTASAVIDYVEFSTKGNAADFGDLTSGRFTSGANNNSRGVFMAGATPTRGNIIDYITISTLGNAADFGDTTISVSQGGASASNTRAIRGGGSSPSYSDVLEYVTISTTGNAADFGDLIAAINEVGSLASSTRAVWAGGEFPSPGGYSNVMEYITMATTGNSTDFGDLTVARQGVARGNVSNSVRGVFAGGIKNPGVNSNIMDYITIASTGNATDYGDLINDKFAAIGSSNGHGGLVGG
jgi:hypothetical protein